MKNCNLVPIAVIVLTASLLSPSTGLAGAADSSPMTPEYAARKENFRKQNAQRITNKQRKSAAESLKTERMRVYKAKQDAKHSKPVTFDNK